MRRPAPCALGLDLSVTAKISPTLESRPHEGALLAGADHILPLALVEEVNLIMEEANYVRSYKGKALAGRTAGERHLTDTGETHREGSHSIPALVRQASCLH